MTKNTGLSVPKINFTSIINIFHNEPTVSSIETFVVASKEFDSRILKKFASSLVMVLEKFAISEVKNEMFNC